MDVLQQILVWMVMLLTNEFSGSLATDGYQGCWQESVRNRHFHTSPGHYDPESMIPTMCQSRCGVFDYKYAALYNGKFCFCGQTLPTAASAASSTCDIKCAGDNSKDCGGQNNYVSVYETIQALYGLQVSSDINTVTEAPATATLTYSVETGQGIQYSVDYDDGASFTVPNEAGFNTRKLYLPGKYVVTMRATGTGDSKGLLAATGIELESGPEDVENECDVMTTHEEGSCVVTVWKGSNLNMVANIPGQSSSITVTRISDPMVEFPGHWSSNPSGTTNDASATKIYLLMATAASHDGKIYGWRVHIKTPGTVTFLVMKPQCGQLYCPLSNACGSSCPPVYDCTSGGSFFCMQKAGCSPGCQPHVKDYGTSALPVSGYEITYTHDETFSATGEHWVVPSSPMDVTEGSIMAIEQTTGGLVSVVDTTAGDKEQDIFVTHATPTVGQAFTSGTASQCRHIVQPYVSYGAKAVLKYTFTGSTGTFPLTVTVTNNRGFGSSAVNTTDVTIVEGIDRAVILGPTFVKLGDSSDYTLATHTGSGVTYSWSISNGHTYVGATLTYTIPAVGTYNVSVTASNSVSSKTNTTQFSVQEEVIMFQAGGIDLPELLVTGLAWVADNGVVNQIVLVNLSMTTGSDYSCQVIFGDGADTTVTSLGSIPHNYTGRGSYTISVTCSNDVSTDTATGVIQIQEPISDLRLVKDGAASDSTFRIAWLLSTGSDLTFNLVFDGNPLAVDLGNSDPSNLRWVSVQLGPVPVNGYPYALTATNALNSESINGTFRVLGPIVGPTFVSDLSDVTTDDTVTFTLDLTSGSDISVNVDFQDGSPNKTYVTVPSGAPWAGPWVFTHDFINGCSCSVTATISNAAGSHVLVINVFVKVGFSVLQMSISDSEYYLYEPPALLDSFYLSTTGPMPTDPTVTLDWGDGSPVIVSNTYESSAPGYSWKYDDVKTYALTMRLENSFTSKTFRHQAIVVEKLVGPKIALEFPSAPLNLPFEFTFSLYRGDQGQHTILHWDLDDGNGVVDTERQGSGEDGADTRSVTYTSLGTKTVTITATAPLNQSVSAQATFQVIQGIDDSAVAVSVNADASLGGAITFQLQYNGATMPTNAFVVIDYYGDGSSLSAPIPFTIATTGGTQSINHIYPGDGLFNAKTIVYNDASRVSKTVQAGVYQGFSNLKVQVTFKVDSDAPNPLRKNGLRNSGQLYPLDKEIYFKLSDDNNAFATSYTMRSTAGPESVMLTSPDNDFPFNFTTDGTYTLEVTATNPLNTGVVTVTIDVVKRVEDLEVKAEMTNVHPGQAKRLQISLGAYGSDTCVYVDWDDMNEQHMYNDDPSACTQAIIYPHAYKAGSLQDLANAMVSHRYLREGRYTVTVEARNTYGVQVKMVEFPISYTACTSPEVLIHHRETSVYYAPTSVRSSIVRVLGLANIDCPQTYRNNKSWTLEEVDIDGKTLKSVDLSGLVTTRAELYIPALTLPLGIYKATYTMTMLGATGAAALFTDSKFTYFKITPSELLGALVEGRLTELTLGSAQTFLLEPLKWSSDPDVKSTDPQGLTVVKWTCEDLDSGGNSSCLQNIVPNAMSQNIIGSKWTLGSRYSISVHLAKDTRSAMVSVVIVMNGTSPPQAVIRCFRGSICYPRSDGFTGIESSKISLECDCAQCSGNEVYEWRIFIKDYRWSSGWRPIREPFLKENSITTETCGPNDALCIFSKAFSLKKGLFEEYGAMSDVVRAQCLVHEGPDIGGVSLNIYINKPPRNGNCTITPKSRTATVESSKQWRVHCYNWRDEDGIKEFQVTSVFSAEEVEKEITSYPTRGRAFYENVSLPIGPAYRDYVQDIYVTIRDSLNAATKIKIAEVQVLPPPFEEVQQYLKSASKTDNSDFFKTFHEGDQRSVTEIATVFSLIMTADANKSRIEHATTYNAPGNWINTGYGPSDQYRPTAFLPEPSDVTVAARFEHEEARNVRSQLKLKMLEFALGLGMGDIVAIQQLSGMLAEVTAVPTDLTSKAQEMVLEASFKMLENLDDPVKMKNVPQEEVEKAMKNLIISVGGVIDAAGINGGFPTLDDMEAAQHKPEWKVYDTSIKALGDDTDVSRAKSYDEAMWLHTQNIHKSGAGQESQVIAEKAAAVIERAAQLFQNFAIPGQSQEATGYRLKYKMEKNIASNFLGTEFKLSNSDSAIKLPDKITDIFPDNSVKKTDTLTVQLISTTNAANRYGQKGQKFLPLEVHSHFLTIDIYDKDGTRKTVPQTLSPIQINIPNDPHAPQNTKHMIEPFVTKHNRFQVHKTETKSPGSSIHLAFEVPSNVQYLVVVRFDGKPDPANDEIDYVYAVPPTSPPNADMVKPYDILIDNNMTNDRVGEWYFGVVERNTTFINDPLPTNSEIAERYLSGSGEFANYNLTIRLSGCFSYTRGDTDWTNVGCLVGKETSSSLTSCLCSHMTTFVGGLLVVPNTIDWGFVFANADFLSNPTLYITEIVITVFFILLFLLARRKDKADVVKRGLAPLLDNDPADRYYYEITVCTGMRPNSGTNSKVYLVMASAEEESPVRWLCDSKRDIFKRGMTNGFLMAVPKCMGHINYIRVWHDNSGKGKFGSWFLNYIAIKDLQTDMKEVFIANRWFAVEEDDGLVDRIIPLASKEQLTDFSYQFGERSKKDMVDGHLWFSVVAKPPQSKFTCVERVACCLCLLFMTMLTNAMFYDIGVNETNNTFEIGPFSMSVTQLSIGLTSTIIVFPANFLLVLMFRKSQPRKEKETSDQKTEATISSRQAKPKIETRPGMSGNLVEVSTSQDAKTKKAGSKSKKKKRSWKLPWWCRILAWILLVILTAGSAVMVTFYGISFEDTTCRKWITSLIFSFFTSVFITQPVKVFLTAVFLSLVIKNPVTDDDEEDEEENTATMRQDDFDFLHSPEDGINKFGQNSYKPLNPKQLEKIRAKRVKEVKMWAIIREIIFYLIFLWTLMVISHQNRSADNFRYKDTMYRTFIKSLDTKIHYEKIQNREDFWMWAKSGLLNGLQAGSYYNDYPPLRLRTYINDKASRILGYATLRQHRIMPGKCEVSDFFKKIISECNEKYSVSIEDTGTFDIGWRKLNTTSKGTSSEYKFSLADKLNGYPYWGYHAIYSGGGYVAELNGNKTDILIKMERLEEEQWIDRYTRTVFVEFTVYNPQVNLFSVNTMLTEFDQSNGAVTSYRFEPAMLLPYANSAHTFYIICEIMFVLFIAVFLVLEMRQLYLMRLKYFVSFWNMVELSITAFSLAAVVMYFYRLHETNKLTKQFKADMGNKYIKFQYVGYWNEILAYMIGIVVFLTTLKLLRLLRFNQRVSMLGNTLQHSSKHLFHFGIIAMVVFLAFCQLFFLTYMNVDEKYSTFIESVVTSTLMMMGKFNIYTMIMTEPILTQIFVLLFVVSLTFIIVNMFVSILNDTFSDVRDNIRKQSNEYEILEFMFQRFQSYTGIHFFKKTAGDQKSHTGVQGFLNDDVSENMKEGLGEMDTFANMPNMKALPERFERLLHSLTAAYNTDCFSEMFDRKKQAGMHQPEPCVKEPYYSNSPFTAWNADKKRADRRTSFPQVDM